MMAETTSHLDGAHYGPSSKFQIQENNKHRAKPTVQYELSPTGPIRTEILTHFANQKNAEIDRENNFMEKRLARRKNQAKQQFNDRTKNEWGLE